MTDLRVTTISEMDAVLEETAFAEFKRSLRCQLLRPDEDGYDAARKVFNGMIDRRTALIARCAGVADVIHCVNFARVHHLLVAVRGGGHSKLGRSLVVPEIPSSTRTDVSGTV
jgi:hypothetical protein